MEDWRNLVSTGENWVWMFEEIRYNLNHRPGKKHQKAEWLPGRTPKNPKTFSHATAVSGIGFVFENSRESARGARFRKCGRCRGSGIYPTVL